MPKPYWETGDYDPSEAPHVGAEILGRGRNARKSKTFIPDLQLASILARIRNYPVILADYFRATHAKHYTITVETKDENGNLVKVTKPHVLTDDELREFYPVLKGWEDAHQESVEHYNSIKGFGVIRATQGGQKPTDDSGSQDSSAGANRGKANARWQ